MRSGLIKSFLFYESKKTVQLFILIAACGIINIEASTLSADDLRAHPVSIVFDGVQGHTLNDTRSVFIFSSLGTTMTWNGSDDVSWLTLNSHNGITNGVLKTAVNTTGLQPGIYHGNITLVSTQSGTDPVIIPVTLIINPDVPVKITTWKDGYSSAMSVSVDDGERSGFDPLMSNGFSGTYVSNGTVPPSFYTDYFNAGMELGSHTVNHPCYEISDVALRSRELEPNISGISAYTPEPRKDIISLIWPCGYTNYREQAVAADYFLSARGYNINQLEDATPENLMNLKSYNSHESTPYPPSDFKIVVDAAIHQQKWFNLVLHRYTNEDGAITYAHSKDIWVTSIGTVIKYILQRDRFILTDYNAASDKITFNVSRLRIPSSAYRGFESAFGSNDVSTLQININYNRTVDHVLINGTNSPFRIKDLNGHKVLLANINLDPENPKSIEIDYQPRSPISLSISGVTAKNKVYDGSNSVTLSTGSASVVGVLAGDDVTLNTDGAAGTFVNKNAGLNKSVTTSGFTLGGADAGKYSLIQPTLSADITKASLTSSGVTANNKLYDGTTAATLNTGSAVIFGVFTGDAVNLISSTATGTFANKNAGTGKVVSTSGFSLGGTDAVNYTFTSPQTTADITKVSLTVSGVTANNKVYDGTTSATLNISNATVTGVIAGDIVNLISSAITGTFVNKNAGAGKTVSATGFSLGGRDAGNYMLTQPALAANISAKELTIRANNLTKLYGTNMTFAGSEYTVTGLASGDVITGLIIDSPGAKAQADVGTYAVSARAATTDNYNLTFVSGILTIKKANLTAKADNQTRVYGSDNPALTISYTGFVNGENSSVLDVLPVAATTANSTGDAGLYGITLSGGSDNNYDLTLLNGSINIIKAPLIITAEDKTKVYGSANPDLTVTYSGFVRGQDQSILDALPVVETNAETNSDAGNYSINVSGASDSNYSFIYMNGTLNITKADQFTDFVSIPDRLRMTQEYRLKAAATSGLEVNFAVTDPNIANIKGNMLTVQKDGTLTIIASQEGDSNWNPAPDIKQTIETLPTFDGISSLFTPNNDGMNDYWYIPDLVQYGKVQVTVYNRFNKRVYQSDSYKNDWDGTWNGYPLPSASYYYIIRSSTKGFIRGVVNIVR